MVTNGLTFSGKHVLLVEDIIDTGLTMASLVKMISDIEPKSLKVWGIGKVVTKRGRHTDRQTQLIQFTEGMGYWESCHKERQTYRQTQLIQFTEGMG